MWSNGAVDVTLIEPREAFVSCPISNLVIGGSKTIADVTVPYDNLSRRWGVNVVRDTATGIDVDTERNEAVLEIEMANGTKIIVSGNTPVREIWVAAKSGGFHYRNSGGKWLDSRSGEELFAGLSRCVSAQSGEMVILARH